MNPGSPENKPAIRDIFLKALEIPSVTDRQAYLDAACGADANTRARVEALLRSELDDSFLERPAVEVAPAPTVSQVPLEGPGTVIGHYRLLEKLGEGGFGVVYMAEQKEPVKRRVALKIIKVGMDTREVVARFEAERQALALMDHPNIAKVLDAGATGAPSYQPSTLNSPLPPGRPYFVMELVRGTKITDYCDEKNLSTRERLDLFIKVCSAVQHAHQKGIIHRDLKPSNILVTVNDGVAVPKIIDFGIAKATQMELTEKTVFTRFEQFLGTPAYMSPEQAELTSVDIDTRSDIYSLGVLLYELLTGKTPFDVAELLKAGLDEMRRTIREQEPQKPSTRVSTLKGDELTTTAERRGLEPPKLASALRGDLDWIVMKCLEKDRARRYETANGLATDLQRHLNNEPVVASPPSNFYRFRKLVRRNRVVFASAAAMLLLVFLGVTVSTSEAVRARRAEREQARLLRLAEVSSQTEAKLRQQAQSNESKAQANENKARTEAAKSQQVARFLKDMLAGVGPSVAQGRDTTMLREILDKTAERVGKELTNQPEVEIEVLSILASTYEELGLYATMQAMAEEELRVARARFGAQHPSVATALHQLGVAQWRLRKVDPQAAEATLSEALALRRELLGEEHPDTADTLDCLAKVLWDDSRLPEAEALARQALEIRRRVLGEDDSRVPDSLHTLARVLWREGKLPEAEDLFRRTLALQQRLWGDENPAAAGTLANLALVVSQQGRLTEAEPMAGTALAVQRKTLGDEHPAVASSTQNLMIILAKQGKSGEAEALLSSLLTPSLLKRPSCTGLLKIRGGLLAVRGRWREAVADFTEGIELDPSDPTLYMSLSRLLVAAGQADAYEQSRKQMLARFKGTRDAAYWVAGACLLLPPSDEDLAVARGLTDIATASVPGAGALPWSRFFRAFSAYRLGRFSDAENWASRVVNDPRIAWEDGAGALDVEAYAVLAMARYRQERTADARITLAKATQLFTNELGRLRNGDTLPAWGEVVSAQILLSEAWRLIEGTIGPNTFPRLITPDFAEEDHPKPTNSEPQPK